MWGVRQVAALAALTLALLAAGCGGEGSAVGGAADVAPADALAFVALDTDLDGDQWKQAQDLAARFPSGRDAFQSFIDELAQDDLDFETDVKPALGPDAYLVVLAAETDAGGPRAAFLTQPEDPAKLDELLERSGEEFVKAEIDDWTVVAQDEATLAALRARDDSLADESAFEDAMGKLPEEALVRVFVDGGALARQTERSGGLDEGERAAVDCLGSEGAGGASAFALSAEDGGVRLTGVTKSGETDGPDSSSSELSSSLPGGAIALVSINGLGEQARRVLRCLADTDEEVARQIAAAELGLGVSIDEDVLPLFDGETAVAVYEGTTPAVVVASEVEDEEKARATLARIIERASAFLDEIEAEGVSVGGLQASRLTIRGTQVFYAVTDGKLVVTSSEELLASVAEGGGALAEDDAFRAAAEAAGAPDETAGLLFADLEKLVGLALGLSPADVPAEGAANLEPLESLFLWGEHDVDWFTFEGLLGID